jgi:hypothetical protein
VLARRHLVLAGDYLVDRLTWQGLGSRTLDLPFGGDIVLATTATGARSRPVRDELPWRPVHRPGAGGLEDGFDFLADVAEIPLDPRGLRLRLRPRELADQEPGSARVAVLASPGATLWRAARARRPRTRARGHGRRARDRRHGVRRPRLGLQRRDGLPRRRPRRVAHAAAPVGRIPLPPPPDRPARPLARARRAAGRRARARGPARARRRPGSAPGIPGGRGTTAAEPGPAAGPPITLARDGPPLAFALGEAHYLRSEQSWDEAGRPAARVTLSARDDRLLVTVAVRLGRAPAFVPPGTENPLDNERAGINGDGLQLHLGVLAADLPGAGVEPVGAWLLVPVAGGDGVDVTRTSAPDPTADAATPRATWAPAADGWRITCSLPLGPLRARAARAGAGAPAVALAVVVNEMPAGRERRRGQLVLGAVERDGGAAAFVYLRGDRHDPARGVRLRLPPAP